MGTSEKKTDIWGREYTQHYNDDGTKAGYSKEETGIFGDKFQQHYDNDYKRAGWSKVEQGIFGDSYEQHYDQDYAKTGWTRNEQGFFGNNYKQHYTEDYKKSEWTENKIDLLGKKYKKHHETESPKTNKKIDVDQRHTYINEHYMEYNSIISSSSDRSSINSKTPESSLFLFFERIIKIVIFYFISSISAMILLYIVFRQDLDLLTWILLPFALPLSPALMFVYTHMAFYDPTAPEGAKIAAIGFWAFILVGSTVVWNSGSKRWRA